MGCSLTVCLALSGWADSPRLGHSRVAFLRLLCISQHRWPRDTSLQSRKWLVDGERHYGGKQAQACCPEY